MRIATLKHFPVTVFFLLGFMPLFADAAEKWAAMESNSELSTGVVWGKTEVDARREAEKRCLRVSKTCSTRAAVTMDMEAIFVITCCETPRFGCVITPDRKIKVAQDTTMEIARKNGFSNCSLRQAVSADTGRKIREPLNNHRFS